MDDNSVVIEYPVSGTTQTKTFEGDVIKSISPEITTSLSANELVVDNVTVIFDFKLNESAESVAFLENAPYGASVKWINSQTDHTYYYYVKKVKRLSVTQYELDCVSFIGILDDFYFPGIMFASGGLGIDTVLGLIILGVAVKGYNIPYRVDSSISSKKFFGFIPRCTYREALHQILFTTNTTITRDDDGTIVFFEITSGSPTEILPENVFVGGSYSYTDPVGEVEVSEHTYAIDGTIPMEVVFDNTNGNPVTDYTVVAEKPMVYYQYEGNITGQPVSVSPVTLTVTGQGVVKGLPYRHTEMVIRKTNPAAPNGKTISIKDIFCITPANAQSVLDRLYNYYTLGRTVELDVKYTGERCGKRYAFTDAFGERKIAYLEKMSMSVSSFIRARMTLVPGYIPPSAGYNTVVILVGRGTWSVPAGVTRFSAFLVGGGSGGASGLAGEDGIAGENSFSESYRAEGGTAGTAGVGGKVVVISVTSPTNVYNYQCGAGGAGGAATNSKTTRNAGSAGGDTTFGSYSSASGSRSDGGVLDGISGNVYGKKGEAGSAGGRGGYNAGGVFEWEAEGRWGELAPGVGSGLPGGNSFGDIEYIYPTDYRFFGGTGGGAAYRGNGSRGEEMSHNGATPDLTTGTGGAGGSAGAPDVPTQTFGWGGRGGSGGGGGGTGGYLATKTGDEEPTLVSYAQSGGAGGAGGAGGRGQDGCIVILY